MHFFSKLHGGISILGLLILAMLTLVILGYFNISIRSAIQNPSIQGNLSFIGAGIQNLWSRYLAGPAEYLWQDVWVKIFWQGFINNMERIRDGKSTDFDNAASNLKINPGGSGY